MGVPYMACSWLCPCMSAWQQHEHCGTPCMVPGSPRAALGLVCRVPSCKLLMFGGRPRRCPHCCSASPGSAQQAAVQDPDNSPSVHTCLLCDQWVCHNQLAGTKQHMACRRARHRVPQQPSWHSSWTSASMWAGRSFAKPSSMLLRTSPSRCRPCCLESWLAWDTHTKEGCLLAKYPTSKGLEGCNKGLAVAAARSSGTINLVCSVKHWKLLCVAC